MEETLLLMRTAGYSPRIVVDAGANVGNWTQMVRPIFPEASFHLIEAQTACVARLRELVARTPTITLHAVAVSEPGISRVRMLGGGDAGTGTGAWVAAPGESAQDEAEYPAATLDELLAGRITPADRCLLKLDLEGHESKALAGAERLLAAVEAVLTEVQFYDINCVGRPVFTDMINLLRARGFELYDFAALSPRPRDMRLRQGDAVFVRKHSSLLAECSWD